LNFFPSTLYFVANYHDFFVGPVCWFETYPVEDWNYMQQDSCKYGTPDNIKLSAG